MRSIRQTILVALGSFSLIAALSADTAPGHAATAEPVDHSALRVCADPHNLPFSNDKGEGFENKIAELLAQELGLPVRYTWFPNTVGFVRNTLQAQKCDLVTGMVSGSTLLQNTNPYYRSAFALVYRKNAVLTLTSLNDPALQKLEIGVIAGTPPATVLAEKGLLAHVHSYQLIVDTRFDAPGRDVVNDVATGKIDVGVLWGPIAGHYAKHESTPLTVVPLRSELGGTRLDYRITMGVRYNEPEWKRQIDQLIRKKQAEINHILLEFGVPLLDERGDPITQ